MNAQPRDHQLYGCFRDAVHSGLRKVQRAIEEGTSIRSYDRWAEVSKYDNGMPNITVSSFGSPPDYSSVFDTSMDWLFGEGEEAEKRREVMKQKEEEWRHVFRVASGFVGSGQLLNRRCRVRTGK